MTDTSYEEAARANGDMVIGIDAIRGETELCIFAIGTSQLIGRCVGRDKRTGRFLSLTKRLQIGAYTDVEQIELERRPNPRKALPVAARLVVGLTLVVVTAPAPKVALAAAVAAVLLPAAVKVTRAVADYLDREFVQQWRLMLALVPSFTFLVWVALR